MTELIELDIHTLEPDEIDAAVELVKKTQGDYDAYDFDTGDSRDLDSDRIDDLYEEPKGRFWVAKTEGIIVGTIGLRRVDDKICRLKRLSVHADYRRHDVPQKLVAAFEEYARTIGYRRIITELLTRQKPAAAFLETMGFEEWKRTLKNKIVVIAFEKSL